MAVVHLAVPPLLHMLHGAADAGSHAAASAGAHPLSFPLRLQASFVRPSFLPANLQLFAAVPASVSPDRPGVAFELRPAAPAAAPSRRVAAPHRDEEGKATIIGCLEFVGVPSVTK